MIPYNFRNRGPFEYDKFVLNVCQYHNQVNLLVNENLEADNSESYGLKLLEKEINDEFDLIVGSSTKKIEGMSEKLYSLLLLMEENIDGYSEIQFQ